MLRQNERKEKKEGKDMCQEELTESARRSRAFLAPSASFSPSSP